MAAEGAASTVPPAIERAEALLRDLVLVKDYYFHDGAAERRAVRTALAAEIESVLASLSPEEAEAHQGRVFLVRGSARLQSSDGASKEAREWLGEAVKREPRRPDAWDALGELAWRAEDLPAARRLFEESLLAEPTARAAQHLSMVLRSLPSKDPEERLASVRSSVAIARDEVARRPGDSESWYFLANAQLSLFFFARTDLADLKKALAAYQRAVLLLSGTTGGSGGGGGGAGSGAGGGGGPASAKALTDLSVEEVLASLPTVEVTVPVRDVEGSASSSSTGSRTLRLFRALPDLFFNRAAALRFHEEFDAALQSFAVAAKLDPAFRAEPLMEDIVHHVRHIAEACQRHAGVRPSRVAGLVATLPSADATKRAAVEAARGGSHRFVSIAALAPGANPGVMVALKVLGNVARTNLPPAMLIVTDGTPRTRADGDVTSSATSFVCAGLAIHPLSDSGAARLNEKHVLVVRDPFVKDVVVEGTHRPASLASSGGSSGGASSSPSRAFEEPVRYRSIHVWEASQLEIDGKTSVKSLGEGHERLAITHFEK